MDGRQRLSMLSGCLQSLSSEMGQLIEQGAEEFTGLVPELKRMVEAIDNCKGLRASPDLAEQVQQTGMDLFEMMRVTACGICEEDYQAFHKCLKKLNTIASFMDKDMVGELALYEAGVHMVQARRTFIALGVNVVVSMAHANGPRLSNELVAAHQAWQGVRSSFKRLDGEEATVAVASFDAEAETIAKDIEECCVIRIQNAESDLREQEEALKPVAGGSKDGKSWKADLDEDATFEAVAEMALTTILALSLADLVSKTTKVEASIINLKTLLEQYNKPTDSSPTLAAAQGTYKLAVASRVEGKLVKVLALKPSIQTEAKLKAFKKTISSELQFLAKHLVETSMLHPRLNSEVTAALAMTL